MVSKVQNGFNYYVTTIFTTIMCFNFVCLLLLSSIWSLYLLKKLAMAIHKRKRILKSPRHTANYIWVNDSNNSKSNIIKTILMLVICLSECAYTSSILGFVSIQDVPTFITEYFRSKNITFEISYRLGPSKCIFETLIYNNVFRLCNALFTISVYSVVLCVRILTQYMVKQYSYYDVHLNLMLEVIISIFCLLTLFMMSILPQLIILYYICIVFVVIREYLLLYIESKVLRLLLKQRLRDAVHHEHQSWDVVLYYRIANQEYKYCSITLLIAFFIQFSGFALYCIYPILMTLVPYPNSWCSNNHYNSSNNQTNSQFIDTVQFIDKFVIFSEIILTTLGTSLQIIPFVIVSIRLFFRNIRKRYIYKMKLNYNPVLRTLIEDNHSAYRRSHYN